MRKLGEFKKTEDNSAVYSQMADNTIQDPELQPPIKHLTTLTYAVKGLNDGDCTRETNKLNLFLFSLCHLEVNLSCESPLSGWMTPTPYTRERSRGHSYSPREAARPGRPTCHKKSRWESRQHPHHYLKREGPHAALSALNDSLTGSTLELWLPAFLAHSQLLSACS